MYVEKKIICRKTGKLAFLDKKDAQTFINSHHFKLRLYLCLFCHYWHTSKKRDIEDKEYSKIKIEELKHQEEFIKYLEDD